MNARAAGVVAVLALGASAAPARADDGDRFDGATIGKQAAAGIGAALLGGGIGGVAGMLIGASQSSGQGDWGTPLLGAVIGGLAGGEIGLIWGVQYEGDEHEGTGRWWGTVAGGAGGIVLGGAAMYYGVKAKLPFGALMLLAGTCLVGGPIVGYHLSGDAHASMSVPLVALTF